MHRERIEPIPEIPEYNVEQFKDIGLRILELAMRPVKSVKGTFNNALDELNLATGNKPIGPTDIKEQKEQ